MRVETTAAVRARAWALAPVFAICLIVLTALLELGLAGRPFA